MRVKIAGLVTMVDAHGEDMDRAEAVTLFNDMCLLAPGTLLDARIQWEPVDAQSARARFTHGGQTVAATLIFGEDGLPRAPGGPRRSPLASAGGGLYLRGVRVDRGRT